MEESISKQMSSATRIRTIRMLSCQWIPAHRRRKRITRWEIWRHHVTFISQWPSVFPIPRQMDKMPFHFVDFSLVGNWRTGSKAIRHFYLGFFFVFLPSPPKTKKCVCICSRSWEKKCRLLHHGISTHIRGKCLENIWNWLQFHFQIFKWFDLDFWCESHTKEMVTSIRKEKVEIIGDHMEISWRTPQDGGNGNGVMVCWLSICQNLKPVALLATIANQKRPGRLECPWLCKWATVKVTPPARDPSQPPVLQSTAISAPSFGI